MEINISQCLRIFTNKNAMLKHYYITPLLLCSNFVCATFTQVMLYKDTSIGLQTLILHSPISRVTYIKWFHWTWSLISKWFLRYISVGYKVQGWCCHSSWYSWILRFSRTLQGYYQVGIPHQSVQILFMSSLSLCSLILFSDMHNH